MRSLAVIINSSITRGEDMRVKLATKDKIEIKCCDTYITIPSDVYYELCEYVKYYDTEVSGCGLVERINHVVGDKDSSVSSVEYKIIEIFLPKEQDNSGSATDIKPETIHALMVELIELGKDVQKLKLHWHSHANMGVFHSGTDEDNYNTLANGDFLVSLVGNHDLDFLGRIDIYGGARITVTNVPVYIDMPELGEVARAKALENILILDKYIEEHKVVTGYSSYDKYKGGYWSEGKFHRYEDENKDVLGGDTKVGRQLLDKEKNKARSTLRIGKKITDRIDACDGWACRTCDIEKECNSYSIYMYGLAKSGGYEDGYGGCSC